MFRNVLRSLYRPITSRLTFQFSGQIKKKHQIGRWIEFISSLPGVESIVEVGTWNGRGSSKAIVRGVLRKTRNGDYSTKVWGFEVNPRMFEVAKKSLANYRFFTVVFGSLVSVLDFDRINLTKTELDWLNQDEIWVKNAPFVLSEVPDKIDLLILDGGEFSSQAEFMVLKSRVSQWIILDDTNTRKCRTILEGVKKGGEFEIIWESNERHGTAVLFRHRK